MHKKEKMTKNINLFVTNTFPCYFYVPRLNQYIEMDDMHTNSISLPK